MITVATLNNLSDAFVLRSMLEASGIPAFIPDENTAQVDWALSTALGGMRVQVPEEFQEKAKLVVADFNSHQDTPPA
jgi:hypothetical protein